MAMHMRFVSIIMTAELFLEPHTKHAYHNEVVDHWLLLVALVV